MTDYSCSKKMKETDPRQEVWARQREERGFDDTELWNLDVTICKFILPRLKAFAANIQGVPGDLTEEQWADILAHMLQSFEAYIEEDYVVKTAEGKEGFTLFVTYLRHLWN